MTSIDDLWGRIEETKKRLGAVDQAEVRQIEDLNERIKSIRGGLARRHRELEQHREEVSQVRHENEQLRRMLHRLLMAIEQRYGGRLKDILKDLETQVSALVTITADPAPNGVLSLRAEAGFAAEPEGPPEPARDSAPGAAPDIELGADREVAAGDPVEPPAPAAMVAERAEAMAAEDAAAAPPSESDSRWLHEIMERAQELTGQQGAKPQVAPPATRRRSAVA